MVIFYPVKCTNLTSLTSDYVLGATTCALFLSLRYHRLHPEYIYNRIQKLGKEYNLRFLLIMVDIVNPLSSYTDWRIIILIHSAN
jgi:DNA repair protein Rad10